MAVTGLHRKAATRRLRQQNQPKRERRGRQKIYTGSVVSALTKIWRMVQRCSPPPLWRQVRQKNWSIVRRTIGYHRFEFRAAHQLLSDIYAE